MLGNAYWLIMALTRCWLRAILASLLLAAGLLWPTDYAGADSLSEGQCREDKAATQSLWHGIDCATGGGWDDYVSCSDPEAAPDRCDPDTELDRQFRKLFGNPFFRTRAEARAWCAAKSAEPRIYGITDDDLRLMQASPYGGSEPYETFGRPVVYTCPDGRPHATVMISFGSSFICSSCGKFMRLPEHTFFRISV